jgi:hypothetical protein
MSIQLNLRRPNPLYFCWKKATNTLWDELRHEGITIQELTDAVTNTIELNWGCKTMYVHRKEGYVTSVDVEFANEADQTLFALRWA